MNNRDFILEYVNTVLYEPKTIDELYDILNLNISKDDFDKEINYLLDNYDIFLNKKKDRILSSRQAKKFKGYITIKNYDYGFITNDFYPDFYVSRMDMMDAMNQDYCLYKISDDYGYGRGDQAEILKILSPSMVIFGVESPWFLGRFI